MAGLVGFSLGTGGFGAALAAFVVAAAVVSGLMLATAAGVAGAHTAAVERIRSQTPTVKRWGGYLLVVLGAWLLALAAFADTFAELFPV